MPTVGLIGGLRVTVYPNDHRPAHVHLIGKGCEAVFDLNCPNGPPELRENFGFAAREVTSLRKEISSILSTLCAAWSRIHGKS